MCDMTHSNVTWLFHMRWLQLVGSLKVQVSFAKEPYKRDYILFTEETFKFQEPTHRVTRLGIQYIAQGAARQGAACIPVHVLFQCVCVTHSYVWHDSFICACVTWLIHTCTCDVTHSYVYAWHDSFVCVRVAWLIHMCMRDMTHSCVYVWHDSFICVCVTWLIRVCTCDVTHSYVYA